MIAVVCEPRGRRRGSVLRRGTIGRPLENCRVGIAALVVLLRSVDDVAAGRFLWAETTTLLPQSASGVPAPQGSALRSLA